MISPHLFFEYEPIINLFYHVLIGFIFFLSITKHFNNALFIIFLSSISSIPVSISLIILNNLDFTKKNIESKILAKKLYIVLTTLEPISVILIFIGLVIIASENFKKRQSVKE